MSRSTSLERRHKLGAAHLILRELVRNDLKTVTSWRAKRELISCLAAPYRYIGPEVDDNWFDGYLSSRTTTVRCAVARADRSEQILGLATLAEIDWIARSCVFHVMVAPDSQGCGVGGFALRGMLRHAFSDLGLNRVELTVLESNARARALYEKAGFVLEGTLRAAAWKDGHYEDMHIMSVLRDEWKPSDIYREGR